MRRHSFTGQNPFDKPSKEKLGLIRTQLYCTDNSSLLVLHVETETLLISIRAQHTEKDLLHDQNLGFEKRCEIHAQTNE